MRLRLTQSEKAQLAAATFSMDQVGRLVPFLKIVSITYAKGDWATVTAKPGMFR
jgi:hypothetical protein